MPDTHPLAGRDVVDFTDLLDETFLALPHKAGPQRDYWLAVDARGGRPPRVGTEIASTDETYEALADGRGVCLIAAGNAPLITLGGVTDPAGPRAITRPASPRLERRRHPPAGHRLRSRLPPDRPPPLSLLSVSFRPDALA
jgi:DNA-binding transcriptional LysR family regulator